MKSERQRLACLMGAAFLAATAACPPASAQDGDTVPDRYWELGVGCYFGGLGALTELDVARFDWLYLGFGNISASPETTQLLNRLLALNPDLKVVIRFWPIGGLGDCPENRYQATFLHYLYSTASRKHFCSAFTIRRVSSWTTLTSLRTWSAAPSWRNCRAISAAALSVGARPAPVTASHGPWSASERRSRPSVASR